MYSRHPIAAEASDWPNERQRVVGAALSEPLLPRGREEIHEGVAVHTANRLLAEAVRLAHLA